MKCSICRHGVLEKGTTIFTLTRESLTLVVKDVPALVCDNCGEETISEEVSSHILQTAKEAIKAGIQVDIRDYMAV